MTPRSLPPVALDPSQRPPPTWGFTVVGVVLGAALAVLIGAGVLALRAHAEKRAAAAATGGPEAVVRVVLADSSGTGFFVTGPDDAAYVATAYHVVARGGPIAVERSLEAPGRAPSTEAYPDAELVAFDADSDLAVLRVPVPRARFPRMALAPEVAKDEEILSYGFPASSLAKRFGMVSKPGKVLSLVRFPARDVGTGEVLRSDAVQGLLVSTELESGFSGGPTVNARGEVVGVNVTKDLAHRAQNGAVSVAALRALLLGISKEARQRTPTAAEVESLLARVEREYLSLPVERRARTSAAELVSERDLPKLEELGEELRRVSRDGTVDPRSKLSPRAALGIVVMSLPGEPLQTYLAPSTKKAIGACEAQRRRIEELFGRIPGDRSGDSGDARACDAIALRPLVWDLTALAMQWEGNLRGITVSKVETVDADQHLHRAQVRFAGASHVADLWLSTGGGRLRLALFDADGRPAGLAAARAVTAPASAFQGTWRRSEPSATMSYGDGVDAETESDEELVVSVATDSSVSVTHRIRRRVRHGGDARVACGGATLDLGIEQSFGGTLENGRVVAFAQKGARPIGADMPRCWRLFTYAPDRVALLKPVGAKLVMYRTDGDAFPEAAERTRSMNVAAARGTVRRR